MADNSLISWSTVQYRGLFVLGHMNIVLGWRLGTIYIMCPWTNNPLYCTVDREIKPHYCQIYFVHRCKLKGPKCEFPMAPWYQKGAFSMAHIIWCTI